jgi:hypothetical protein
MCLRMKCLLTSSLVEYLLLALYLIQICGRLVVNWEGLMAEIMALTSCCHNSIFKSFTWQSYGRIFWWVLWSQDCVEENKLEDVLKYVLSL